MAAAKKTPTTTGKKTDGKKTDGKKTAPGASAKTTGSKKPAAKKPAKSTGATTGSKAPAGKSPAAKRGASKDAGVDSGTQAPSVEVEQAATDMYSPVFGGRLKIEHDKGSLSSDDWNDANKVMFHERNAIRAELEKLETKAGRAKKADPALRRRIRGLKSEMEDKTLQIVEFNYGLVKKYVRKFTGSATRDQAKEFEQAALLGLMRAIDNYDPTKGRFAQWAFKPIQREVLRAVHSSDHNNMNPGDFERRPEILKALKKLQAGDESVKPTAEMVAREAGVTLEQARRVLDAPRMDSLYTPVGDGESVLGDLIVDVNDDLEDKVLNSISVKALETFGLQALDPRERFVIIRRQGLDCEPEQRLSAIGELLGLSREAIRQIESKAIAKMSHPVLLRRLTRNGKR